MIHKVPPKDKDSLFKIHVEEDRIVATDGSILAIIPNFDTPVGNWNPESFAKNAKDKNYPLLAMDEGYPDYRTIEDNVLQTNVVISLDADLLKKVVDALRVSKGESSGRIVLEIHDSTSVMTVKMHDDLNHPNRKGFIMPCRTPDNYKKGE